MKLSSFNDAGLTSLRQARTLLIVAAPPGARPLHELAAALDVSSAAMTCIADATDAAGLTVRGPREGDRRVTMLAITPKGRKAVERALS